MAADAVETIFEELGKMSVLDLVQLKNKIEDERGLSRVVKAVPALNTWDSPLRGQPLHASARIPSGAAPSGLADLLPRLGAEEDLVATVGGARDVESKLAVGERPAGSDEAVA